jgi:hypothetical protein
MHRPGPEVQGPKVRRRRRRGLAGLQPGARQIAKPPLPTTLGVSAMPSDILHIQRHLAGAKAGGVGGFHPLQTRPHRRAASGDGGDRRGRDQWRDVDGVVHSSVADRCPINEQINRTPTLRHLTDTAASFSFFPLENRAAPRGCYAPYLSPPKHPLQPVPPPRLESAPPSNSSDSATVADNAGRASASVRGRCCMGFRSNSSKRQWLRRSKPACIRSQ